MTEKEKKRLLAKAEKLKPKPVLLNSGKWRCQVTVGGKRVSVTEDDPVSANATAIALKEGYLKKKDTKTKISLNDAILEYMTAGEGVLSPATVRGYETMRKNRFQSLMQENIHDLTRLDIQKAVSEEAKTLSPKTVANAYGLLMAVLKDYGISFTGIKLPQKIKKKVEYLSAAEIVKLIDTARGDACEIPILMAVWLGMRRSEILGLCWDCVDFDKGTVEIKRTLVPDKEHQWVIKDGAKNVGSQRTVKCPDYILSKLKAIYKGGNGPVVTMCPEIIGRHLKAICKKAEITETTLHGLRHTNAAVMIALNVTDKYAMARNGWTSDYTFKQIYGYVFPEGANETDVLINEYFQQAINAHELHTE